MAWCESSNNFCSADFRISSASEPHLPDLEIDYASGTPHAHTTRTRPALERYWRTRPSDEPYALVPTLDGDFGFGYTPFPGQSRDLLTPMPPTYGCEFRHTSPVDTVYSSASLSSLSSNGSIDPRWCALGDSLSPEMPHQLSGNELSWTMNSHDVPPAVHSEWDVDPDILGKFNDDLSCGLFPPAPSPQIPCFQPNIKVEQFQPLPDEYDSCLSSATSPTSDELYGKSEEEEEEDSEYTPPQSRAKAKSLSRLPRSSLTAFKVYKTSKQPTSKVNKAKLARAVSTSSSEAHQSITNGEHDSSAFTCPLTPYGCTSYFTSKNEWKRHIQSHHLATGYWRCDLCLEETGPNVFNRKDLFTAHLLRMHFKDDKDTKSDAASGSTASTGKRGARWPNKPKPKPKSHGVSGKPQEKDEELLQKLSVIRKRCWIHVRNPPTESQCVICQQSFSGLNSCDAWLEHVGKHLTRQSKSDSSEYATVGYEIAQPTDWAADKLFAKWLIENNLLEEASPSQSGSSHWRIADRVAADRKSKQQRIDMRQTLGGDVDGEGELDN